MGERDWNDVFDEKGAYLIRYLVDDKNEKNGRITIRSFQNEKELRMFIDEEIISTAKAAELLNCTRQAIYYLVKKEIIEPVKIVGRDRLFLKSDILCHKKKKEEGKTF